MRIHLTKPHTWPYLILFSSLKKKSKRKNKAQTWNTRSSSSHPNETQNMLVLQLRAPSRHMLIRSTVSSYGTNNAQDQMPRICRYPVDSVELQQQRPCQHIQGICMFSLAAWDVLDIELPVRVTHLGWTVSIASQQ